MSLPPLPDPSAVGGVPQAPFVLPPDPGTLFARRARRFDVLAEGHELAAFLTFLAGLCRAQGEVATGPPPPVAPAPPIHRMALAGDPGLAAIVRQFLESAERITMPDAAVASLRELRDATPNVLDRAILQALADAAPSEDLGSYLFVAAGVQVHAARLAAAVDPAAVQPSRTGLCPICGASPAVSVVVGFAGAEGARYAVCGTCQTWWNEVRVKCLSCGSTKGIGYRAVETGGGEEPTVKAEICDACRSWIKILYQNRNASLEPLADDVASLGLDLLMQDTDYRRAGLNPFLLGY